MSSLASRERERVRTAADRATVLAHYGEVCGCPSCGATEDLGVDHVNGDGRAQRIALFGRNPVSGPFYRWLIERGFPDDIQTMCRPCNSSKADGDHCRLYHGPALGEHEKWCTGCERIRDTRADFTKDAHRPDGLAERCRECAAKTSAAWRERHGVSVSVPAGLGAEVLRYLGEYGPARSGAIARDMGRRPNIMSGCLAALLKEGQVENPAFGVYRLPGQAGELPGVGFGSRAGRRQPGTSGADAQAAWRERHGTSRHVSTNPETAGGRIIAFLRGHGPSHVDAVARGTGLSYWSVAANVAGLLQRGHVERHTRMDGPFQREVKGVYRLPGQSEQSDSRYDK